MSRYQKWAPYVPVAQRRKHANIELDKLRKKGQTVEPVIITGRTIATTFWGKAWCDNLESYQDFENRLPRGRTYARNGSILDLQIKPKEIRALVSGSSIYQVKIDIKALPADVWKSLCGECSVGIDSLVELLQGRFDKGVMDRICRQDAGLFPKPSEIKLSCSCPDYAVMCKHVAAVLYGVGSRLDKKPELLFLLREVDQNDLVARIDKDLPLSKQGPDTEKLLETDDVSELFGLDMVAEVTGKSEKTARKEKPVKILGDQPALAEAPGPVKNRQDRTKTAKAGNVRPKPSTAKKEDAWQKIEKLIAQRNTSGYAEATSQLIDLRNKAKKTKKMEPFLNRLDALRIRHGRKKLFIAQLDAANIG